MQLRASYLGGEFVGTPPQLAVLATTKYGLMVSRPFIALALYSTLACFLNSCGEERNEVVSAKRAITIGLNPSERSENTQKNADLLADLISRKIRMPVTMFVAQDYSGLVEALRARRVDFAFFAPISYVYAERIADARVLLKAERHGSPYYFGCVVVRSDSPYKRLEDLRGKQIAWVDPSSSSGHIFPKAALIEAGIDPEQFFARQTFAGGHDAVLLAVINGRIDAGATFANDTLGKSGSWTQLEEGALAGRVRPIFFSQPIPADNLSTSQYMLDAHPDLVAKVVQAVAQMHDDSLGADVMRSMYHVDAMVAATTADYDPVRRAADLLNLDITGEIRKDESRNEFYSWLLVAGAVLFGLAVLIVQIRRQKRKSRPATVTTTGLRVHTTEQQKEGPEAVSDTTVQFSLRNLHILYEDRKGGEVHALKGANLDIRAGEFTAIIGPSGAGKSTLLRGMNRSVEPCAGEILFNGKEITHIQGEELLRLRRKIGFIFQQFNLIPSLSALQNVLAGRLPHISAGRSLLGIFPKEETEHALRYLAEVGLAEKGESRASELSGGQQQRVAIARALAQEPEAILADEPTASLDPVLAESILTLLSDINRKRGITVIANLHSIDLARRYAKRIIGLRAGQVVFDGTAEELTDEQIEEIYREQS